MKRKISVILVLVLRAGLWVLCRRYQVRSQVPQVWKADGSRSRTLKGYVSVRWWSSCCLSWRLSPRLGAKIDYETSPLYSTPSSPVSSTLEYLK